MMFRSSLQRSVGKPPVFQLHPRLQLLHRKIGSSAVSRISNTSHHPKLQSPPLVDKSRFNRIYLRFQDFQRAKTQNELGDIEIKAEKPRVFQPFLFFIGIGALSFTWAAYMTVKETGDAVARAGKFTELIPVVRENLPFTIEGDENAYWGSLNEQDIRKLCHVGMYLRQRKRKALIKKWCDRFHVSDKTRKVFTKISNRLLTLNAILSEEQRVTVPLIMFSTLAFIGIKTCRAGLFGQNIINGMRKHLSHIPVTNRLHTLATSNFTHIRFGSLFSNSLMISLIGGTYLTSKSFYKDDKLGKSNHTAEATSFFHFIAFCLAAGTFGRVSSQAFTKILLMRARQIGNPKMLNKIGRMPELGASGITYGLLGLSISHAISSGDWKNNNQLPFIGLSIPTLALMLFSYNGALLGLTLVGSEFALGVNVASRLGSGVFGATYFFFGNAYWERLKQIFYERDERLQKALLSKGNLVAAIQSMEPAEFESTLETLKQKVEPLKLDSKIEKFKHKLEERKKKKFFDS